jgi:CHAT domain-containing protein
LGAEILAHTANNSAADARHAAAIVRFVIERSTAGLEDLLALSPQTRDARIRSDIAALLLARADERSRPALIAEAVAAADAALTLDPDLPEARFNRAVAVEQLGLHEAAVAAWTHYLRVDSESKWAAEARGRLRALSTVSPDFHRWLAREQPDLDKGDAATAQRLVERYPQETRAHVESVVLPAWAEAIAARRPIAETLPRTARLIADAFAAQGDDFLITSIAGVNDLDDKGRQRFAEAEASLARAQLLWAKKQPTAAELPARQALTLFAQARNPMEFMARYRLAVVLSEQNRNADARRELEELSASIPAHYRTMRAQALWQLGICRGAEAAWGKTLEALIESASLFDQAGERFNAAFVRQILSEVYDAIGDHEKAWNLRIVSLRELGKASTLRTETAISAISYDAAQQRKWQLANSMLNLEIDIARRIDDPPSHTDALLRRAVARHHLGDESGANGDLVLSKSVASSMTDRAVRKRAEMDIMAVDAVLASNPQESIEKLGAAIDFHRANGREMYLPAFYLQRGRAFAALGDHARARADFRAGIARLERDRETLPDAGSRIGVLDAAEELFTAAIGDAIARGEVLEALMLAERARARTLLDTIAPQQAIAETVNPSQVPPGTTILEFVSFADRLVTFVMTRGTLRVVDNPEAASTIAKQSLAYHAALVAGHTADVQRLSRSLYDHLIAPILRDIANSDRLIIVPSHEIACVPFSALQRPDLRFLVKDHSVVVTPSIAIYLRRHPPVATITRPDRAVVVAASRSADGAAALEGAEREARAIAALYPRGLILAGHEATGAAFLRAAPSADVIHFAGHGLSGVDDGEPTSLLMSGEATDKITPHDVESLRLRSTSTVVLAACNTARGEVRWSEGTLSMARAFMAAGASGVVATLWPIDDAQSVLFFQRLHTYLRRGLTGNEALRHTQLDWIQEGRGSPSLWAAAQSIGW